ncbi:uncharacterized protein F5147DRAFT_652985 [Suillus discolor]|uniref:JmjC domain-containing protein n=1 Tax=Suillus discolor TaxID=1912936 RepID=A0A9P7F7F0_9AGAM|nr:uncharacterized protein F5147DRAFT_652985 [Suillus discolor]KAG2108269.1 hypothetical protein F5147DRAFT_652985 [Suillus discolor]
MPVSIHDAEACIADSTHPHQAGTISSLVDGMNDPTKIQCVLDLPYVHGGLPEPLSLAGVKQPNSAPFTKEYIWTTLPPTSGCFCIMLDMFHLLIMMPMVSQHTFTSSQRGGHIAYASAMMKLGDYPNNKKEVHDLWDAEVVYLAPGDFVIQPPGQVHAAYTPVEGLATGVSFFNLAMMHHSERCKVLPSETASLTDTARELHEYTPGCGFSCGYQRNGPEALPVRDKPAEEEWRHGQVQISSSHYEDQCLAHMLGARHWNAPEQWKEWKEG